MNYKHVLDRALGLDRILASVGIILAVCARIITIYQVHLIHDQARIAVWPNLEQEPVYYVHNPYQPFKDDPIFKYIVTNTGLGPTYIRYIGVKFNGLTLNGDNWIPVMHRLTVSSTGLKLSTIKSHELLQNPLLPRTVLLQGKSRTLFEIVKN